MQMLMGFLGSALLFASLPPPHSMVAIAQCIQISIKSQYSWQHLCCCCCFIWHLEFPPLLPSCRFLSNKTTAQAGISLPFLLFSMI